MKKNIQIYVVILFFVFVASCVGQEKTEKINNNPTKRSGISGRVRCGFLDKEGILWFGTNNGVYSYDGASFFKLTEEKGLCNNQVFSIIEDKEGELWFGTADGLCRYDRTSFTHVPIPWSDTSSLWLDKVYPVMNPNAVHSLLEDRHGNIWVGTGGAGAYRYDGKKFTSFLSEIGTKQIDSLYHNWVPNIIEDSEGNIWFASMTHGGVSRYDGSAITHFMPKDGLSDDMVRTIFMDSSRKLWFGFNGNRKSALNSYDGDTFALFNEKDGLCNKSIIAIYEDKKGHLWLGSGRDGICIYDGNTFKEFTTKEGESYGVIVFILEDAKGNVWFGGDQLFCYDGKSVTNFSQNNNNNNNNNN